MNAVLQRSAAVPASAPGCALGRQRRLVGLTLATFGLLLFAGATVTANGNGAVTLKPTVGTDFSGSSLPSDWTTVQ